MRTLVAGVDCSTQSTKVVVVDADSGEIVALGQALTPSPARACPRDPSRRVVGSRFAPPWPRPGWPVKCRRSRSPASSTASSASTLRASRSGRRCSGTTLVLPRTRCDCSRHWGRYGWAARIGVVPVASFTATKWAWLRRREPQTVARTAAIRLPHDYITERLSGPA